MAALSLEAFEVIHPGHPRGGFRFALFDFDGTLSLIRQGWQGIMIPMMVEILQETGSGESPAALEACVRDFVERLTGKQTIYQMIRLKEEVAQRGGVPLDPLAYKQIYNDRLWEHIRHRVAGLHDGTITPESLQVTGTVALLEGLRARGVSLFLASGTDHHYVVEECAAPACFQHAAGQNRQRGMITGGRGRVQRQHIRERHIVTTLCQRPHFQPPAIKLRKWHFYSSAKR